VRVASSNTEPVRGFPLLPLAEVALATVTVVTVAAMWRIFDDASYFLPLAANAVAAHGLAALLRRRGVGAGTSALVCALAAIVALTWGYLWDTTWYGLPTGETLRTGADQFEQAWRTFGDVRAPAPVLTGFLLSSAVALWAAAWLADLAAFRQWTPFEALIPTGTIFLFTSIFSADRARVLAAVLWITAAIAFVLLHRTARQQTSPSWLGSDARIGSHALVRTGVGLTVAAVCVAWVFGPRLPGADDDPLVPFNPRDQQGSRLTISPLVEMQGRLVEQSQIELFSVISSQRAYWRLTSLDIFDGEVWSSRGSFGRADGELVGSGNRDVPSAAVTQTFSILNLSTIWLPTAFEATELNVTEGDVRWDDVSSTLIVSSELDTSDGLDYEVVSDVPSFEPADLASAGEVPEEIAERNLDLPPNFPPSVTTLAEQIVAGADTPYARALALQESFRDGSFNYSLSAPRGHSNSAIENFLFVTRTGYCEQFAGAYAAMARAIGLPSRVAVGFTPGDRDAADPNRYVVRGENAHAWPEVFIAGAGWVAFEPTPGRGAPGQQAYTGHAEEQDTVGPSTEPTLVPEGNGPGEEPGVEPGEEVSGTTAPPLEDFGAEPTPVDVDPEPVSLPFGTVARWVALVVPLVVAVLLLAGGAVAAARAVGRYRRRAGATTPVERVLVHGAEETEAVVVLGLPRRAHETVHEYGRRLARELRSTEPSRLAELVTRAQFDPAGVSEEEADAAAEMVAGIRRTVQERTSWWQRGLAAMDPRSPERRAQARARAHQPRPVGPRIRISVAAAER
jgi:transglutaminase-like putative cysteine protease